MFSDYSAPNFVIPCKPPKSPRVTHSNQLPTASQFSELSGSFRSICWSYALPKRWRHLCRKRQCYCAWHRGSSDWNYIFSATEWKRVGTTALLMIYFRRTTLNYNCCAGYFRLALPNTLETNLKQIIWWIILPIIIIHLVGSKDDITLRQTNH